MAEKKWSDYWRKYKSTQSTSYKPPKVKKERSTITISPKLPKIFSKSNLNFPAILMAIFRQWLAQSNKKQDEILKRLTELEKSVLKDYSTKTELSKVEANNSASHATIHTRLDEHAERIVKLETKQETCPGRNK